MGETRADRLRRARMGAGYRSASLAARSLGISPSTYIHHENGTRDFGEDAAALYARRFHVTLHWLLLGEGEMATPELATEKEKEIATRQIEAEEERAAAAAVPQTFKEQMREGEQRYKEKQAYDLLQAMTLVPEISPNYIREKNLFSKGWRRYVGLEESVTHPITATWGIPSAHLSYEFGASPQTIIFPVTGDANAPTLLHGDLVFVDAAIDDVLADGFYLIADKIGYPQVRRLQVNLFSEPRSITISADGHPEAKQVVDLNAVTVVGKVVGRVSRM